MAEDIRAGAKREIAKRDMAKRATAAGAGGGGRNKAGEGGPVAPALPPLKPSQCRAYMRRELAREFRGIVQGFVSGAKKGSCQHVKLATELVGTPEKRVQRGKSTVRRLIEELESGQNS